MTKEEFIKFIEELGFTRTWDESEEWSIFPEGNGLFQPKVYIKFTVEYGRDCIRLYHKIINSISTGSNLGFFPIGSIGDFEKIIIVDSLSKYCSELPIKFKKFIRDNKLNSIL